MDREEIEILAIRFRDAIERCERRHLPIAFKDFPSGSCGDTVLILGTFLREQGAGTFNYVLGTRGEWPDRYSHAWMEQGDLIVDITADQFEEVAERILVTTRSDWHKTFEREIEHVADFRIFEPGADGPLAALYARIVAQA